MKKYTNEEWVERFKKVHGDKYDHSQVDINNKDEKNRVKIICPKHGEFWMTLSNHLAGCGCKECMKEKFQLDEGVFKKRLISIFGDKYNTDQAHYINDATPVNLICSKHGVFRKAPNKLYRGQGCPKCHMSHLENEVTILLDKNNINYIYQCNNKHLPWLYLQSLDFYLPDYNIAIECQGLQHFKTGGKIFNTEKLKRTCESDYRKLNKCNSNGVELLYYSNLHIEYPYKVYEDKNELLNKILKGENN